MHFVLKAVALLLLAFCLLLLPLWESVIVLCFVVRCTLLYVHSSIAIILMGKRELVALLNLSWYTISCTHNTYDNRDTAISTIEIYKDELHISFGDD